MLLATLAALAIVAPVNAAVPAGFTDELVDNIDQAMSLVFLPDGRMLIGEFRARENAKQSIDAWIGEFYAASRHVGHGPHPS